MGVNALKRRQAEQAKLRAARGYHASAESVTSELVQKAIAGATTAEYERMLQEWDLYEENRRVTRPY